MSYNGSGTFVINTAGQPVVSGTVISSTAFNALTADLATGLSTAITKDGQTTPTANIPMGNNKITGLAVGTAATDAANLSQVQSTAAKLVNSVSGADTITGTMSPNLGAYATGQMFYFVAVGANTGAVTINIDSLGAKSITRDGTTALAAGDIQSGEVCVIVYDGTQFQLVNGASQSASIVTENLTVNKATVLNESGGDNDTRIEGDTDANLFFADASTDRIGIGTSSPTAKLTISGNQSFPEKTAAYLGVDVATSSGNGGNLTVKAGCGSGVGNSSGNLFLASGRGNSNASNGYIAFGISQATNAVGLDAEYMRLDASGSLGLGTTSPGEKLEVAGNIKLTGTNITSAPSTTTQPAYFLSTNGGGNFFVGIDSSTGGSFGAGAYGRILYSGGAYPMVFFTNDTERARISSGGDVFVAKTSDTGNGVGITLGAAGYARLVRSGADLIVANRLASDGTLISFEQDTVLEGSISVSGNTVSYNAFAGSHWSQLQDGSKPDILRGTVMESINELCEWPGEKNERLPKSKISDTAGSKKVYGVFMAWDNDWTETNDMYVTAVGAFICRVNASVTVEEGDLLESNGDGTARVQADDIIRSSTIGKVTSTVKTHQYDDGSYCVPTVLYCG